MTNFSKAGLPHQYAGQQWRIKNAYRPLPFDGRRRFQRADIARLFVGAGCTCEEMARLCRTGLSNVHYYIRTHGLRDALRAAQIVRFTAEARSHWRALIARRPDLSQNRLAGMEPCAYRWLWRYDRAWLAEHRPKVYVYRLRKRRDRTPPRGQGARIAALVRRAAGDIKAAQPNTRCTKNAIRMALGMTEYSFARAHGNRQVANALAAVIESHAAYRERVRVESCRAIQEATE